MTTQYIEYRRKKYEVKEPTIRDWSEIMRLKDLLDERELHFKLLERITGMPQDVMMSAKATDVKKIGDQLYQYLNLESKQLFQEFEHKGKTFRLVNVSKITFGQFVDVDTFLSKDENYRVANLHELAAYLYNEVVDGKVIKYGDIDFVKQGEEFKDLPIKYLEGAIFFLSTLGKASQGLTLIYSQKKWLWMMMIGQIHLGHIGDGISRLVSWLKRKFGKLIKLLVSPLRRVSITLRSYLTKTERK